MYRAMNSSVWTSLWLIKTSMGDEIYIGGQSSTDQPDYQSINRFTFDPTNAWITNAYNYSYQIIYRANLIIDNFGALAAPSAYQKEVVGEAKVLRAYAYFELTTLWGTPPLVLHELAPSQYNQPNSDPATLWSAIQKDLNDASAVLPVKSGQAAAGSDIARASKGFAQGLLGKAFLFQKKYASADSVFTLLINSGEYGLYQAADLNGTNASPYKGALDSLWYTHLWRKDTEFGKESLFEISFASDRNNGWGNNFGDLWNDPSRTNPSTLIIELCGPRGDEGFSGGSLNINGGWGFGYPTTNIYNAFKNAGDSVRVHANCIAFPQIEAVGGSLILQLDNVNTVAKTDTLVDSNFPWGMFGVIRVKYTSWASETNNQPELNYGTNLRIMRYADVLLMESEAKLGLNDVANATMYYNMVHTRVGLPAAASIALADIKLERQLEFAMEGCRYQDLVRWGDATTALATQGQNIPTGILQATYLPVVEIGATQWARKYDRTKPIVVKWQAQAGGGFHAPKNLLLPFPANEMNANTAIKQNPGY
jgi:hypothetical protein